MRAAILRNGEIVVGEMPDPVPGPGQVLVKTLACGICGSDLRIRRHAERLVSLMKHVPWRKGMDTSKDVALGHEFCCEILKYGPGCTGRLKPGTRVVSVPHLIVSGEVERIGFSHVNVGGYAERMLLSEETLLEVPDHLASIHATYAEPIAGGFHIVERAGLQGGEVPLVIGCGPIGLAVIIALQQLRKSVAFGPIIAADFQPKRRMIAQMLGADHVVDPAKDSPYRIWELHAQEQRDTLTPEERAKLPPMAPRMKRGFRPAVVFECTGEAATMQKIYEGVAQRARIMAVGISMETEQTEPVVASNKELEIRYVLGYSSEEFERALRLLADREVDPAIIVTGVVGLEGVADAFRTLSGPSDHIKIVIEPWRTA